VCWNARNIPTTQTDALRCDSHYWEFQGEKGNPTSQNRQSTFATTPSKMSVPPLQRLTTRSKPKERWVAVRADGKLTEVERNGRVKDSATMCLSIDVAAWTVAILGIPSSCCWSGHLRHQVSRCNHVRSSRGAQQTRETHTRSISTGVASWTRVPSTPL